MGGYSILIVDDQPEVRAALCRALRSEAGEVHVAEDGEQAIAIIEKEGIDLVLSDYDMPGINGLDLLQHIRLRWPQIRRILLTGRGDVRIAARALNEGAAQKFLLKPWDAYELKGIVTFTLHG